MRAPGETGVTYCWAMPKLTDLPLQAVAKIQQLAERGSAEVHYARKMFEAGAFKLEPPQNVAAMVADIRRWGEFGMIPALNARRTPDRTAVIDDDGELTFKELDDSINAVANGLRAMGVRGGDGVALLIRNHRWFLIAFYGAARVGVRLILLNSEFSGPQIKEVSEREGARLIIHDDEYTKAVAAADPPLGKLRALPTNPDSEVPSESTDETLADLIARSRKDPAPKSDKHAKIIILTSGTTGTPKGANRSTPPSLAPIGGVLSHVPFRSGEVTSLPAPMFHALGLLHAHHRDDARLHPGAATALQAGHGARRHREASGDGTRGGARNAVPDPRRTGRRPVPSRTCRACGSSSCPARNSAASSPPAR